MSDFQESGIDFSFQDASWVVGKYDESQRHLPKRMGRWLDNQEVCAILHISPRTLQSLRSNGTLSYTQIDRRTYYQEQDVMRLLGMTGYRSKSRKEAER